LRRISPEISFLKNVDQQTGYRSRQMLVFPILDPGNGGEIIGVVQLTNTLSGLPFPHMAEHGAIELSKTLAIAFSQRQTPGSGPLKTKFDLLIAENIISTSELELAQRAARKKKASLEEVLIDDFQVKPSDIGRSLTAFFGVPYENYRADRIKPAHLLKNLKQEFVLSNGWLPIDETNDDGLVILTPDPESLRSSRIISNVFPKHTKVCYRVCLHRDFNETVNSFFGNGLHMADIGELILHMGEDEEENLITQEDISAAQDNELVKLVNKVIIDAYAQGASDIHIEPYPDKSKVVVRLRRDGSLMPYIEIPPSYRNALVARIKIMAELDISERRVPQDGKIKFRKFGPLDIELRVATLPTAGGLEDIVLRILASGKPIQIEKMELAPNTLDKMKHLVSKPYGLFLVCGPTGSGKTTTLHSLLHYINTPETKIWTAEDPVEITQRGLRQVQVNRKAGLNFAAMMRAFLRADPDVIMVGEMRDKETVSLGIEASLTGHLVMSTLHTNSAPESVVRLLDMGMDPFNFSDALLGILAQRLAKRLCACKQAYTPSADEVDSLVTEYCRELEATESWQRDPKKARKTVLDDWLKQHGKDGKLTLYKAVGCDKCSHGYRGRVGLFELLEGTDALKKGIQEHKRVAELLAIALDDGMRTLKQDGIEKVLRGITDMKQVRSVCIK
jgi:type II secretory ATPase GspE/PulE/Tfp pilus assembly ATPase PilB-like protein